jgi:YgiT-type zinc finger domain-containing protein
MCAICNRGKVTLRNEEISFYQWTDKGYVFCQTEVPVRKCDHCGSKSWDAAAEALIEEAVRREYDKRA